MFDKLKKDFYKKYIVIIIPVIIVYALLFLFEPIILNFLFNHWESHIIKSSLVSRVLSLMLFFVVAILYNDYKEEKINAIDIIVVIVYFTLRFRGDIGYFPLIDNYSCFTLVDAMFIGYMAFFSKEYYERSKIPKVETAKYGVFIPDLSLKDIAEIEDKKIEDIDELSVYGQAKTLAENISILRPKKSFVIGFNGKWGYGKTSFTEMVFEVLETKKNIKTIEISSWLQDEIHDINQEFLIELEKLFSPSETEIKKLIHNYKNVLQKTEENIINVPLLSDFLTSSKGLNELRDSIKDKLKSYDKTIVVLIDDLDRLTKQEVFNVIKLVRVIAEFPNLIFILPYDREYIESAIIDFLPVTKSNNYLDKIINVEYKLPDYIENEFQNRLIKSIVEKTTRLIEDKTSREKKKIILHNELQKNRNHLLVFINNLRDEKKLFNNLSLTIPSIIDEVDIEIFIWLELIKMKYNKIYDGVKGKLTMYYTGTEVIKSRLLFNGQKSAFDQTFDDLIMGIESDEYYKDVKKILLHVLNKEGKYPIRNNINKYFSY